MSMLHDHTSALMRASILLTAMSNEKRLQILSLLVADENSVGQLVRSVGSSQSALSQHLSKLREVDLVRARRDAQTIYYSCHSDAVTRILATLREVFTPSNLADVSIAREIPNNSANHLCGSVTGDNPIPANSS
ncbi:transcriptional regulator [Metarhizobium album]|uniref:Transcriptional regulator n=1 Tax=Metarhizobium album TaxID=2182425 RepID=A0A2U2DKC3_9HYPH|nr:metalloregulator ArsR/SmtB family transcription factor [Rhizobium album]PWE53701.1 transcriptional regulator [Rhizobium album]